MFSVGDSGHGSVTGRKGRAMRPSFVFVVQLVTCFFFLSGERTHAENRAGRDALCGQQWRVPDTEDPELQRYLQEKVSAIRGFCRLIVKDYSLEAALLALGDKRLAATLAGSNLTLYARTSGEAPSICCSLQNIVWQNMPNSVLWISRYRLKDPDEAILSLSLRDQRESGLSPVVIRGSKALPEPLRVERLNGKVAEHEIYSEQLRETRKLLVYTPPGYAPQVAYPLLLLADGQSLPAYSSIIERLIADGLISPIVIIGLVSAPDGIVGYPEAPLYKAELRNSEYVKGLAADSARFDGYQRFVVDTVIPWAQRSFSGARSPEDVALMGFSSGGGFALHTALANPDVIGPAIVMSPSFSDLFAGSFSSDGRTCKLFVSAGLYEPDFLASTKFMVKKIRNAGIPVEDYYVAAGHASDQWEALLPVQLVKLYGKDASPCSNALTAPGKLQ